MTGASGLAAPGPALAEGASATRAGPEGPARSADLAGDAAQLPAVVRRLAGVEDALAAQVDAALPPALVVRARQVAVLDVATAVAEVNDLDELVGLLAALVESCGSAEDLERALAGMSRLCAYDPADVDAATGMLRARVSTLLGDPAAGMAFVSGDARMDVCGVAAAWFDRRAPSDGVAVTRTVRAFLSRRAREVAKRAACGYARELLAAPTHRGGWIDASVLARRLEGLHARGDRPDLADAVQAILRLHPTRRDQALARLGALDDEVALAACYALGAPVEVVGPTAVLWVAAAAVRAPGGTDPLVMRQHRGLCPDGAFLAELGVPADRAGGVDPGSPTAVTAGALPDQVRPSLHPRAFGWAATLWPGQLEWLFGKGREALHYWRDATMAGLADVLDPALDPDVELGASGVRLLVLALAVKDPSCRRAASDVLAAATFDGRVDVAGLGGALAALLSDGAVRAARLTPSLAGVAQTSRLHAELVRLALEAALDGDPADARADLHTLLRLLVQLATDAGTGVTAPAARVYLAGLGGDTKRGRLACQLLALPAAPSRHAAPAAALALHGRVLRAQRWHANAATHPCSTPT